MYKEVIRNKTRFSTTKGMLTTEQLWDLSLEELDLLAVSLQELYDNSKGKSFLDKKTTKDKDIKMKFDVVLDVLETKKQERDAEITARERKENNEKILTIIAEKQDDALKGLSIKELKGKLL